MKGFPTDKSMLSCAASGEGNLICKRGSKKLFDLQIFLNYHHNIFFLIGFVYNVQFHHIAHLNQGDL